MVDVLGAICSLVVVAGAVVARQPFRENPFKTNVKNVVPACLQLLTQLYHQKTILSIQNRASYVDLLKVLKITSLVIIK